MSRLEKIRARANQKPRGPWGTLAQEDIEWLLKEINRLADVMKDIKYDRDQYRYKWEALEIKRLYLEDY